MKDMKSIALATISLLGDRPVIRLGVGLLLLLGFAAGSGCQERVGREGSVPAAGIPPWQYERGTSEAEIVSDARNHLNSLVVNSMDEEILGVVYLRAVMPFNSLFVALDRYQLGGGGKADLLIKRGGGGTWGVNFPDDVNSVAELESLLKGADPWAKNSIRPGEPIGVSSFMVYGRASGFKRLWDEHQDEVRLVGVLGIKGHEVTNWYPVDVGEPLR